MSSIYFLYNNSNNIDNILKLLPRNAGTHNSIYRGEDITDLFYNGTLSEQIKAGTFDDIFIGDYVIGKESQNEYLVADLDYRLNTGDTEISTHHILMIPKNIMGIEKMNDTSLSEGAYVGSKMFTEYLEPYKTIIKNDFGEEHILQHRNCFADTITDNYESKTIWMNTDIDLMNELMVYGSIIFHNILNETNMPYTYTPDTTQLSLFKLAKNKIIATDDNKERQLWWLRDVASSKNFTVVNKNGNGSNDIATHVLGVRPAFLVY